MEYVGLSLAGVPDGVFLVADPGVLVSVLAPELPLPGVCALFGVRPDMGGLLSMSFRAETGDFALVLEFDAGVLGAAFEIVLGLT